MKPQIDMVAEQERDFANGRAEMARKISETLVQFQNKKISRHDTLTKICELIKEYGRCL